MNIAVIKDRCRCFGFKLPSELLEIRFKKFMFKRSFWPYTRLFYDTLCTHSIIVLVVSLHYFRSKVQLFVGERFCDGFGHVRSTYRYRRHASFWANITAGHKWPPTKRRYTTNVVFVPQSVFYF